MTTKELPVYVHDQHFIWTKIQTSLAQEKLKGCQCKTVGKFTEI